MGLPPCLIAGLELGLVWLALGHVGSAPGIVLGAPQVCTEDGAPWVLLLFGDSALEKVTFSTTHVQPSRHVGFGFGLGFDFVHGLDLNIALILRSGFGFDFNFCWVPWLYIRARLWALGLGLPRAWA